MKVLRQYLTIVNTLLTSILLGLSIALAVNTQSKIVAYTALICAAVFLVLTLDSVNHTRKTLFKHRERYKPYGQTFTRTVQNIFKSEKPHPMLEQLKLYYEVPMLNGSTEYVDRLAFYMWLSKVWGYQNAPYRHSQASPLGQRKWIDELGGLPRYQAYLYILTVTNAIDPESTYHVKRLRTTPWNIILLADHYFEVKTL